MNRDLAGPPLKVEPPNPLMEKLDAFKWQATDVMPRGRWKVWSGPATEEFVKSSNLEAATLTGEKTGPFEGITDGLDRPGARVVLGLLDRELVFRKALHRATGPLKFDAGDGKKAEVRFFGVRGERSGGFGHVVSILAKDAESDAVQIAGDADESAVLYLPQGKETFEAACLKLRGWRAKRLEGKWGSALDPLLHENDDLRIPFVSLEAVVDFAPVLAGGRVFEGGGAPWMVIKAEQRVKFHLTERGAKVRAEVELGMDPFGDPPKPPPMIPRKFLYDRPFFVFIWRDKADWPYFGAWIGDSGAMEAWE